MAKSIRLLAATIINQASVPRQPLRAIFDGGHSKLVSSRTILFTGGMRESDIIDFCGVIMLA